VAKAAGWHSLLVRGAVGVLLLRVSLALLTLCLNILLVRWLGTADYGAYAYSLAWLIVLGVPALLGLDQLLVRSVAACRVRSAWGPIRRLMSHATGAAAVSAVGVALLAWAATWLFSSSIEQRTAATFGVALLLLPLITLTRVRQAILQGLHHVVVAQLPETLLQPLLLLALVAAVGLWYRTTLTAPVAMGLNVAATAIAFLAGWILLWQRLPRREKDEPPTPGNWSWVRSSLPLMCFAAVNVLSGEIDLLILGALREPDAVGIYSVAIRTAELIPFVLQAINPAVAPHMASLYAAGNIPGLQRLVTVATRAILAVSLPVAVGLLLWGPWFLRLLYGSQLVQGQTALAILCVGQLVNVGMGPVGMLLTMTGHERDALVCLGISGLLNFVLSLALIPGWGAQGAAVAACSSMVLWNLLTAVSAYCRLGIQCGPLPLLCQRTQMQ
jgi:O-antigen/teichoic acid export membrane protein